jgi:protease-4
MNLPNPSMEEPIMSEKKSPNPLVWVLGVSAAFFVVFLVISAVLSFSPGKGMVKSSPGVAHTLFNSSGVVGVLELNGVIMDSKKILSRLERLEESDQVKAVVLRLNSPGGSVAPSQEIYEAVKAFKKPLVISMGSVAASGAYYIAAGAKKVFANPGTLTGSIGVIMEFMNLEKLYGWAKVERFSIKSGKFKDIGAEYREMTSDERNLLQSMVADILSQFRHAVSEGRGLKMEHVVELSDGRIFSGKQARDLGLVDELGTMHDAIVEAGKEGGIKGKPSVYYIEKPKSMVEKLFDDPSADSGDSPGGLFGLLRNALMLAGQLRGTGWNDSSVALPITTLPGPYLLWGGVR